VAEVEATGTDTVGVAVGDVVVIRLPENTTSGYVWSVGELSGGLEPAGEELVPPGAGAGAAGERVVRVRAVAPGAAVVVLVYAREWEPSPVEQRRVRVTVRE
jgi:inhibitor of cysteine peptidase